MILEDDTETLLSPQGGGDDVCAFPLSFAQERLWFLDQLQPGQSVYNMYDTLRWPGYLSIETLEHALARLIERHETLRTSFAVQDGKPVQLVFSTVAPGVETIDISDLPEAERSAVAQHLAIGAAAKPFDLAQAPLLRAHVICEAEDCQWLVLVVHHIVSDGWSMRILHRELGMLYDALRAGQRAALAPLPIQYPDYAIWQRQALTGLRLSRLTDYWSRQLAGAPPLLALDIARRRPAKPSYRGALHNFSIDRPLSDAVHDFARHEGVTPFMALLTAFKLLLARHSAQTDIVVGTPIANRTRSEVEGLIGFFANTLVLRTDIPEQDNFRVAVAAVRRTTLDAYEHQDLPFEQLVDIVRPARALDHNPLFQVMFVLNAFDAPTPTSAGDDDDEYREVSIGHAKFDLHLTMVEVRGRLRGILEYATDLFDAPSVAGLADQFVTLLRAALSNPAAPVNRLPLLDAAMREKAIAASASPWPRQASQMLIHERFAEQARSAPDAIALRAGAQSMTYGELDRRANGLAHWLAAAGIGPDIPVGIYLERSIDQIVAVLGVLKASGCYVPLDPGYPRARLEDMYRDCAATIVIGDGRQPPFECRDLMVVGAEESSSAPEPAASLTSLAYILYTSGSTGRPKGIAMPHGPLANLISWQCETTFTASNVLQFTTLNFDVSAQEIFSTLGSGATLVLASEDQRRDAQALRVLLATQRIERLFLPAAALQALAIADAEETAAAPLSLREIITAGEQLQLSPALRSFLQRHGIAALHNQYGPTETHVASQWSLDGTADDWPELPPIGRAIAGARLYVLDRFGEPVPDGMAGEIHIGGCLPARGYVARPDETADRFVADPLAPEAGARRYRTGDLGRRRADGAVEFLGRCDRQIKVRGVRVEPGEIEAVLRAAPGVAETVVFDEPDPAGGRRLVACVVYDAAARHDVRSLYDHCRAYLADAMIPTRFVALDALPQTPSGKLDRMKLPALVAAVDRQAPAEGEDDTPMSELEAPLAAIWCEVLGVKHVGRHDNFFSLGGHSLLATRVAARIRKRFGVPLPLRTFFENPNVDSLARALIDLEVAQASGTANSAADGKEGGQ